ncbi:MAG: Ribose ABC transporter, ATP-binding protein RbsA (TC 3.A.1.2.1) [Candidatus Burkholderia crenata]|nr:MAG: Ribose ABC transporter, ATP-binding protein RbsA (TC 3.A.1.2.1) [Candidatus Burkholderia crenata]
MVEIARNLIGDCRVLILDEPTAMLTAREVDLLFEQVERLKARVSRWCTFHIGWKNCGGSPGAWPCCATASGFISTPCRT